MFGSHCLFCILCVIMTIYVPSYRDTRNFVACSPFELVNLIYAQGKKQEGSKLLILGINGVNKISNNTGVITDRYSS
jgi:hypothetical protein